MLGQQYFENSKFQDYFSSHFIMFRANRTTTIGQDVFKKFNIMGTPTVMILEPDGSALDWHVGYGPPPEKFHEKIDRSLRGVETFKFYAEQYAKDPQNLNVVFRLAGKHGERFDQAKATALYNEVLAIDPDGKQGSTEYGKTRVSYTQYAEFQIASLSLYGMNGGPEAFRAFIRKYRSGELVKAAYERVAYLYSRSSARDSVTQFYEEALKAYPEDIELLGSYVDHISASKSNVDRGIEVAGTIMEIMRYREDPRRVGALASLYTLKGDTAKADSVYGKDFIDNEVTSLSYSLIDYARFWADRKTNTESALAMAEMSLKLNPDNAYLLQQTAGVYCKLDKTDRALELFGPAYIGKYPDDLNRLHGYANFWTGLGKNLESALAAARRLVELSPTAPYYRAMLAGVHEKMKNFDEAVTVGEKAVELADESQKAYYTSRLDALKRSRQTAGTEQKDRK